MRLEVKAIAPVDGGLKVIAPGHGDIKLLLDGKNITNHCRDLSFHMGMDSVVMATIEFMPDELIVDADVLMLKGNLPEKSPGMQDYILNVMIDAIERNARGIRARLRDP